MTCHSTADALKQFGMTLLFCVGIAFFLGLIGTPGSFSSHLIVSLSIGILIHLLINLSLWLLSKRGPLIQLFAIILMIVTGTYLGLNLGLRISADDLVATADINRIVLNSLPFGLLFGGIISLFFYSRGRLLEVQSQARAEELKRIEQEKELIQAQLKLLQAQIEPHFLFNTLANVHSLIATKPDLATTMLENLNQYLRAALDHSRSEASSLSRELELLKAYLDIQQVRMGDRLSYHFDVPDSVAALPFPPMLLQPLVENAVKHGLEPTVAGGNIDLRARLHNNRVEIKLIDNGNGLDDNFVSGVGLSNVRERLHSLFAEQASFNIATSDSGGVIVCLSIPTEISSLTKEGVS